MHSPESSPRKGSRTVGRRLRSFIRGLFTVSLIAAGTYALTTPTAPPQVRLPDSQLSAYTDGYNVAETYGGTNPIDTCTGCDFWGKQDVGTETQPSTNPDEMVNPATGDLTESDTLFSDPDPGFNLQFNLSYDALYTQAQTFEQNLNHQMNPGDPIYAGPFGWGWTTDGDSNVVNYSDQYSAVTLPTGAVEDFDESTCPPGASLKTISGSGAFFCAADRVDASFGEFNNYASYQLNEQGGEKEVTYDFFGRVTDEGTLQDPNSINYLYNQAPLMNGCPDPAGTYGCTVVTDQLSRHYAVAFNSLGIAIEVQDPANRAWTFGYNSGVDLASVTDPLSHAWQFGYDTAQPAPLMNDLTSLTDPDNNTTRVAYTPSGTNGGLVASVTDAMTSPSHTTTFTGWNVASQNSGVSYATTEIHPDGQQVVDNYTNYELELEQVSAVGGLYNDSTSYAHTGTDTQPVETITDAAGNVTTDVTDEVGNILTEHNNYGTTTTEYNTFDEPCWSAPPSVSVPSSPSCTNAPAAGAGATLYSYDTNGNQIESIDPTGVATYSNYDAYGNLCWRTIPGTTVGTPPPCTSPPAASTRYSSNSGTELLSESTPDGSGSSFTYDTTTYTYNPYGEVLTDVTPDGNVSGGTPANYTTTNYYDNAGRLYLVVAPLGRTTSAVLDAAGNVDSVVDPMGQVTSAAYDADNRTCWSFQGTATSICGSPPATSTRYSYNVDTPNPLSVEDPNSHTTFYSYINAAFPNDATTVTDPLGNVTSNIYDSVGNLCVTGAETTSLYLSPEPNCVWSSGYTFDTFDQLGNVLTTKDPSGSLTAYARGKVAYPSDVTTVTPPAGGKQMPTIYSYDLDGRLQTETEGNGTSVTTTYTPTGQKCWQAPVLSGTCASVPTAVGTSAWSYYNSQLPLEMADITTSGTKYTAWGYDAQGQETLEGNNGGQVAYAYDFAGDNTCVAYPISATRNCANPASTTNTVAKYSFDNDGRMKTMADWLGNSFTFGYDARSNLTSITYPTSTTWTENFGPYDAANNLPALNVSSPTYGTGAVGYTYNADEDYSNQAGTAYTYNAKKQVATGGAHTFGYNPNGEIATDTSGGTTTYLSYAGDTELSSMTTGLATTSYNYDLNGNRCATAGGTGTPSCTNVALFTSSYGYTAYNQLCYTVAISVAISNPSCASPPALATMYSYDGNGLRTSDTATLLGNPQNFLYNTQTRPGQPLIIEDGNNAYIYGPADFGAGTAPLEQIPLGGGAAVFPVNDPNGVFAIFSTTGATIGSASYTTYGTRTVAGLTTTPFGFEGAYTDPDGLLYLINRYYDPSTDQFLSVDPLVEQTGQAYAFDLDDPLNVTDPLGLAGCGGNPFCYVGSAYSTTEQALKSLGNKEAAGLCANGAKNGILAGFLHCGPSTQQQSVAIRASYEHDIAKCSPID